MIERDGMRTAYLVTGSGSTMEAAIKASKNGEIDGIVPAVVIASTPDAGGLQKADKLGVKTEVAHRKAYSSRDAFGKELLRILENYGVDLVGQFGWLPLT